MFSNAYREVSPPTGNAMNYEVIVKYNGDLNAVGNALNVDVEILSEDFGIITLPRNLVPILYNFSQIEYIEEPKNLYFSTNAAMSSSCITAVQEGVPYNLTGNNVIVAVLDSGIDYTHKDFRNTDGTSRILYIWDQTGVGTPPADFNSGVEYSKAEIDAALKNPNPYETLPEVDQIGHGTVVTGIAAGNGLSSSEKNIGAAPGSSIIFVKLGTKGSESFSRTTELMRGIKYVMDKAVSLNMPMVINISYGTSDGSHDGRSLFETYISEMSQKWKTVIVVASGNEGSSGHHYFNKFSSSQTVETEFVTTTNVQRFYLTAWKSLLDDLTFEIILPNGQSTGTITYRDMSRKISFPDFDIDITYGQPDNYELDCEIYFNFIAKNFQIPDGLWKLKMVSGTIVDGRLHIWMPISESVSSDTKFLVPNNSVDLTIPSTTMDVITVGGYDYLENSIAEFSGRGYTRNNVFVKPDLVAPAVNIIAPVAGGGYDSFSGTSVASPFVTGSVALMMEWGIVRGNDPFLYGQRVKSFLQYGANRDTGITYPNLDWGYGKLCLKKSLDYLANYTASNKFMGANKVDTKESDNPDESKILSNDYIDITVDYTDFVKAYLKEHTDIVMCTPLSGNIAILYVPSTSLNQVLTDLGTDIPTALSGVFGLCDAAALDSAGITPMQNNVNLNLRGNGVLLGFVDTGIDFTNSAFKYEDGTSKIRYIWDQTISGKNPENFCFGAEYTNDELNTALASQDPFLSVSHKDIDGHGTFLASVAGSHESGESIGAAPDADIIVVKLKKAKPYDIEAYLVPQDQENAYQATDIMLGMQYILTKAQELNMPVAICLGLSSNFGSHDGNSMIEKYIGSVGNISGVCVCVAAGNESNTDHHTFFELSEDVVKKEMKIRSDANENGFTVSIMNFFTDQTSVSVTSPSGEVVDVVPARPNYSETTDLVLANTKVTIEYYLPVHETGSQLTIIKLLKPIEGIWTITVYGDIILDGRIHAWLPITGFCRPKTTFLSPTPDYTLTLPATSTDAITIGAYSQNDNSLYVSSSWAPNRNEEDVLSLCAPGVEVLGDFPTGQGRMTGTSVAAAITTGACALMLQWGIVDGHRTSFNTIQIKTYLVRGCTRPENEELPSQQIGYGYLNLAQTFAMIDV